MNEELVILTHNDLDALGCMLNIEYKWPTLRKKFFHTNYSNIPDIVDDIERYVQTNGNKHIIIPDVSFSTDKSALRRLYNLGAHVTHIDHHQYPDGFWDEFTDMKVVYDDKFSATYLTNEYLGLKGANKNLDTLTYLCDVYDIWRSDNEHFDLAQDLNNYFWQCDIGWLFDEIISNDYKLPKNYIQTVQSFNKNASDTIAKYESKNLILRNGEMTVCFVNQYFNQIVIKEFANGKEFVIGVNDYGIVRIRVNRDAQYSYELLKEVSRATTKEEDIGHLHAFTYKMPDEPTYENVMKEISRVAQVIIEKVQSWKD